MRVCLYVFEGVFICPYSHDHLGGSRFRVGRSEGDKEREVERASCVKVMQSPIYTHKFTLYDNVNSTNYFNVAEMKFFKKLKLQDEDKNKNMFVFPSIYRMIDCTKSPKMY